MISEGLVLFLGFKGFFFKYYIQIKRIFFY